MDGDNNNNNNNSIQNQVAATVSRRNRYFFYICSSREKRKWPSRPPEPKFFSFRFCRNRSKKSKNVNVCKILSLGAAVLYCILLLWAIMCWLIWLIARKGEEGRKAGAEHVFPKMLSYIFHLMGAVIFCCCCCFSFRIDWNIFHLPILFFFNRQVGSL